MRRLLIILFPIFSYSQSYKDSTMRMVFVSNGAHNGLCCWLDSEVYILHWSYEREQWCLLTDSLYDAYYKEKGELKKNK